MYRNLLMTLLLAGASVTAQAEPQKGAEAAAKAAPDDLICTYESSVGSHIKRRVCVTRAEREATAGRDQDALAATQRRGKGYKSDRGPSGPSL